MTAFNGTVTVTGSMHTMYFSSERCKYIIYCCISTCRYVCVYVYINIVYVCIYKSCASAILKMRVAVSLEPSRTVRQTKRMPPPKSKIVCATTRMRRVSALRGWLVSKPLKGHSILAKRRRHQPLDEGQKSCCNRKALERVERGCPSMGWRS